MSPGGESRRGFVFSGFFYADSIKKHGHTKHRI